jgi:hypothetical protein
MSFPRGTATPKFNIFHILCDASLKLSGSGFARNNSTQMLEFLERPGREIAGECQKEAETLL